MHNSVLQLWSVIGTWVASIGTVAAVITSLWLALHQNTIKLKVSAKHRFMVSPSWGSTPDCCVIFVVNIGLRPAKITQVSWQVGRGKKKKYLLQTFGFPGFEDIPKTLYEGDDVFFVIPFNYKNNDDDWIFSFPRELVGDNSPNLIKTLQVCVYTSTGKTFKNKAEKS